MKLVYCILILLVICLNADATNLQFRLGDSQFGISQTTNALVTVQAWNISLTGQWTLGTLRLSQLTDTNGQTTFTNIYGSSISGFYHWTVAPYQSSQRIQGDVWIQSTNLGTVTESIVDTVNGAPSYPAGTWCWSAQAADLRYQLSGINQTNLFYPLNGNPSNYVQNVLLLFASNSIVALIPSTNGFVPATITNGFSTVQFVTNYVFNVTNNYGNIVLSNASSFITPLQLASQLNTLTNPYTSIVLSNPSSYITPSQQATALINLQGTLTALNLFGTNWVTTNSAALYYPTSNPSSFISQSQLNSQINSATQSYTSIVLSNPSSYVTPSSLTIAINNGTNGLDSFAGRTNQVGNSTNNIGIASGLMAFQPTNLWTTYNNFTNVTVNISNTINQSSSGGVPTYTATNTWLRQGNTVALNAANITNAVGILNQGSSEAAPLFIDIWGQPVAEFGNKGWPIADVSHSANFTMNPLEATLNLSGSFNGLYPNNFVSSGADDNPVASSIIGGQSNTIWCTTPIFNPGTSLLFAPYAWGLAGSTILNGWGNIISNSSCSVAGGYYANVASKNQGSFVWADTSVQQLFSTTTSNQFLIRSYGGVGINTNITVGNSLTVQGNAEFSSIVDAGSFTLGGNPVTNIVNGLFLPRTNGVGSRLSISDTFSIGGGFTWISTTNVIGATNGVASGTYQFYPTPGLYSNLNQTAYTIGISAGTWFVYSNGSAYYSSSTLYGPYSVVGGAPSPAPTVYQGGYINNNGWIQNGYSGFTNTTVQNTAVFYIATQASTLPVAQRPAICYTGKLGQFEKTNATLDNLGWYQTISDHP